MQPGSPREGRRVSRCRVAACCLHSARCGGRALRAWRACWRLSWAQLQPCLDRGATLAARRDLFFRQALNKARHVLEARQDLSLRPLTRAAVHEGCAGSLLATLDQGECAGHPAGKPDPAPPALSAL